MLHGLVLLDRLVDRLNLGVFVVCLLDDTCYLGSRLPSFEQTHDTTSSEDVELSASHCGYEMMEHPEWW